MLNLADTITPPQAGSERAKMSPIKFIISSPTRDSVKRKASLPEVSERHAKQFRLEPPPNSSDMTIEEYQQRVNRDEMTLMIPFESTWTKMLEEMKSLREQVRLDAVCYEEVNNLKVQNNSLQEQVRMRAVCYEEVREEVDKDNTFRRLCC